MAKKKRRNEEPDIVAEVEMKTLSPEIDIDELAKGIVDVDDLPPTMTGLVYSEVGVGKTTFGATWPAPRLFLDFREKGSTSIRGTGSKVIRLTTWDQLVGMYWYLRTRKHPFKTVIIDTVNQAVDAAMQKVLEMDEYEGLPIRKHWGQMTQLVKPQLLDFRDLADTMNVLFLCQRKLQDDENMSEDMPYQILPLLSPAIAKSLGGAVDFVGYLYVKEKVVRVGKKKKTILERVMRVQPHPEIFAKIRVPQGVKAPTVIKEPTYQKLYEIMIEGKGGKA